MSNEHREHDHAELQEEHDHGVPEPLQYIDEPDDHQHDHDHDDHEGHQHGHEPTILDPAQHRAEGVALFNAVWGMLDADDRTPEQADQMVHAAHASRWHWSQAGKLGGDQQLAVGEWRCARVYWVLGVGSPPFTMHERPWRSAGSGWARGLGRGSCLRGHDSSRGGGGRRRRGSSHGLVGSCHDPIREPAASQNRQGSSCMVKGGVPR